MAGLSKHIGLRKLQVERLAAVDEPWFVAIHREACGPMSAHAMRALWHKGEINLHSLCWRDGFAAWENLGRVPELDFAGEPGEDTLELLDADAVTLVSEEAPVAPRARNTWMDSPCLPFAAIGVGCLVTSTFISLRTRHTLEEVQRATIAAVRSRSPVAPEALAPPPSAPPARAAAPVPALPAAHPVHRPKKLQVRVAHFRKPAPHVSDPTEIDTVTVALHAPYPEPSSPPVSDPVPPSSELPPEMSPAVTTVVPASLKLPPPPAAPSAESEQSLPRFRVDVFKAILAHRQDIQACVTEQHSAQPSSSGVLVLEWSMDGAGAASHVAAKKQDLAALPLTHCLSPQIENWHFEVNSASKAGPVQFPFRY